MERYSLSFQQRGSQNDHPLKASNQCEIVEASARMPSVGRLTTPCFNVVCADSAPTWSDNTGA